MENCQAIDFQPYSSTFLPSFQPLSVGMIRTNMFVFQKVFFLRHCGWSLLQPCFLIRQSFFVLQRLFSFYLHLFLSAWQETSQKLVFKCFAALKDSVKIGIFLMVLNLVLDLKLLLSVVYIYNYVALVIISYQRKFVYVTPNQQPVFLCVWQARFTRRWHRVC